MWMFSDFLLTLYSEYTIIALQMGSRLSLALVSCFWKRMRRSSSLSNSMKSFPFWIQNYSTATWCVCQIVSTTRADSWLVSFLDWTRPGFGFGYAQIQSRRICGRGDVFANNTIYAWLLPTWIRGYCCRCFAMYTMRGTWTDILCSVRRTNTLYRSMNWEAAIGPCRIKCMSRSCTVRSMNSIETQIEKTWKTVWLSWM